MQYEYLFLSLSGPIGLKEVIGKQIACLGHGIWERMNEREREKEKEKEKEKERERERDRERKRASSRKLREPDTTKNPAHDKDR